MTIIEVHGYKFGIKSGGFDTQAGAEEAKKMAVGYLWWSLYKLMPGTIYDLHKGLQIDGKVQGRPLEEQIEWNRAISRANTHTYNAVKRATRKWRCWEQGYVGETPWLSLSAVEQGENNGHKRNPRQFRMVRG